MKCSDCGGKVKGWRRGSRCKACDKLRQEKRSEENKIAKLAAGVNYRQLLPRHKGKR